MRILASLSTRRRAALGAAAVLVASASLAGVAFAGSGGDHPHKSPQPNAGSQRAPDALAQAARTALQALVANGTIDQAQANAIEHQVVAGQIDPAALIAAGTVNAAQMRAVARTLERVKLSAARASGGSRVGHKSPASKAGSDRAPAVIVHAARTALDRLVTNGTIDQAQATTILRHVVAGSVDPAALVAAGTLNHAQMGAVMAALQHIKSAVAASHP